jgi:hypothetical protein
MHATSSACKNQEKLPTANGARVKPLTKTCRKTVKDIANRANFKPPYRKSVKNQPGAWVACLGYGGALAAARD